VLSGPAGWLSRNESFECVAGLILLGWSTAFLFHMLGRIEAR
jgi:hypothetical protein